MAKKPKRVVVIGLDGANLQALKPLLEKKLVPNLARLLSEGAHCVNAYAPYPTLTGSNWATIATGAWPGTHGVTDMSYHVTGEPIDYWHSGFTSQAVEAQTLWEAIAATGKKSIILKYTGSWPPRTSDVVMVDGGGGRPFWGGSILELSHSQLFSTEQIPNGNQIRLEPAEQWKNLPESNLPIMEFSIDYEPQSGRVPEFLQFGAENIRHGQSGRFWGLVYAQADRGYDRVSTCLEKDFERIWFTLEPGQWSQSLERRFEVQGSDKRGTFRVKLDWLDPTSGQLSLYFSQVYPIDEFTQPAELGEELIKSFGAYINHPAFSEMAMGWFKNGPETFIQAMEYQNEWLANAASHLLKNHPWDLFMMQCHCIDFANHTFVARRGWSKKQIQANQAHLERCYQSVDRMIGQILDVLDTETLLCVVSDHGATESPSEEVFINKILEEAGLLAYEQVSDVAVRPRIDLTRTLAQQQRSAFVYVNLQGRDPGGIVPAEQYEQTVQKVIDALRAYREPTTGRNPFAMILRKEDARILGLYDNLGRDIGDIVYALLPEFDHEHGRQLPAATLGGQSMKPLLIFHGPGVKAGAAIERTAWLVDVVPSLAYAMDWPMPGETEGSVLYQIFADHRSQFPREDRLKAQQDNMRRVQKELAASEPTESKTISVPKDVPQVAAEQAQEADELEQLPDNVDELKQALRSALAEAKKWKTAYQQYHRITHGN